MPREQLRQAPPTSAGASSTVDSSRPSANDGRTPKVQPRPDSSLEPWALLLETPPLNSAPEQDGSHPQQCSLNATHSGAGPPLEAENLLCEAARAHVRPDRPREEPPPAPEDLGFQRGFPDPTTSFAPQDYGSPCSLAPRAPPHGPHSPCTPGPYPDVATIGTPTWQPSTGGSFSGATFGVPPPNPKPFSYPFPAPHRASPKPFLDEAASQAYTQGMPLFASPRHPGTWTEDVTGSRPPCPLSMPPTPAPPFCYASQASRLDSPRDLGGTGPEAGAVSAAPSSFSGSRTNFVDSSSRMSRTPLSVPELGGHGEPSASLPSGHFPGPGPLDLPLVVPGNSPTRLPQLWGPANPPFPSGAPLGPTAAARMMFLENQSSAGPRLGIPQGAPLPWAQLLPPAGSGTQQMRMLNPPFPRGGQEWSGGSQGAGGPGEGLGVLGTSPGPPDCPHDGLKGPGASPLLFGVGQPQSSPKGQPLSQGGVTSPSESPLPSPAPIKAASSCSSLSPTSGSPAHPSSEDSQHCRPMGVSAFFHASTNPQDTQLPDHFQPTLTRAFPFSPRDTGGTQGTFESGQMAPFPTEGPPYSEQHFLDQLDVLLTCRQCDRNYSSVAAFLGHRPFCNALLVPAPHPGPLTPPATPKAPAADGATGLFPVPRTGSSLLAEGKEEATVKNSLLPAAPCPLPSALDLDLEDEAKLDSLITEALHGLECQAHSPDIDSCFIDVFTDEEPPGPRVLPAKARTGPVAEKGAQPSVPGSTEEACSRPLTHSCSPTGSRPSSHSQQSRGKRFKLPVPKRCPATATDATMAPGSRGPCLRPRRRRRRRRSSREQREPVAEPRRQVRGRTWGKDVIHKKNQKNQQPSGRYLSLRPRRPPAHCSWNSDSKLDKEDQGPGPPRTRVGRLPQLSSPRGPRGKKRKRVDSGPPAAGVPQKPRKVVRQNSGAPLSSEEQNQSSSDSSQKSEAHQPLPSPGARGNTEETCPLLASDPATPGIHHTSIQEVPNPEITDELPQDTPTQLPVMLGVPLSLLDSLAPVVPQPCSEALTHPGIGSGPDLVNDLPAGSPHSHSTVPVSHPGWNLPPMSSASTRPESFQPPLSPLPNPGLAPLGTSVPEQGEGKSQLGTRRPENQLLPIQLPGAPEQELSRGAFAPKLALLGVCLSHLGSEASREVNVGSTKGEWSPPKAEGDSGVGPSLSREPREVTLKVAARSELPTPGPPALCRQRAGRTPRSFQALRPRRDPPASSHPEVHLAPDMTIGGVGAPPQGDALTTISGPKAGTSLESSLRTSPQDEFEGLCQVLNSGRTLPPPQLPAVGPGNTTDPGGSPLTTNIHRPSDLKGGRGGCRWQPDPSVGSIFNPESPQLDGAADPGLKELIPVGGNSLIQLIQEDTLLSPSGRPSGLPGLQSPQDLLQKVPCIPKPVASRRSQQGQAGCPPPGRAPKNQAHCPRSRLLAQKGAQPKDKTRTPKGLRKESCRGSPRMTSVAHKMLDIAGTAPHVSPEPGSRLLDNIVASDPSTGSQLDLEGEAGVGQVSPHTAGAPHSSLVPAHTCSSAEYGPHTAAVVQGHKDRDDTVPPMSPDSETQSFKSGAAHTCLVCGVTFRSRPGLSRHRARRHGLRRASDSQPHVPSLSTLLQDTPRKGNHRPTLQKEKLRQAPSIPSPTARPPPSGELNTPDILQPGGLEVSESEERGGRVRQGEVSRVLLTGGREVRAGGRARKRRSGSACSPCVTPTWSSDTVTSDSLVVTARPPETHNSHQLDGDLDSRGSGIAAEVLVVRKGCRAGVIPPRSVTGSQAEGCGNPETPSNSRDSFWILCPSQLPGPNPGSLDSNGSKADAPLGSPELGVRELEDTLDTSCPGLGEPVNLPGNSIAHPQLSILGSPPPQEKDPRVSGEQQEEATSPPELEEVCDSGTPDHPPANTSGHSALFCLPNSLEPWASHPSLWASHTEDLEGNIPELPVALEEPPWPQRAQSPEPPLLHPEPCAHRLARGTLDLQLLSTQLKSQDLCLLESHEELAKLPSLNAPDLGISVSPSLEIPSKGQRCQVQNGAHKCLVCLQYFRGPAKLSQGHALPPTCYMCVERRFGSHQLLREHLQEKHVQSRAGPWACGMCLWEAADVWAFNEHLQDHALSFGHQGPGHGTLSWEGHNSVLSSLVGQIPRPQGGLADEVSEPEPPRSELLKGRGSTQALAPNTGPLELLASQPSEPQSSLEPPDGPHTPALHGPRAPVPHDLSESPAMTVHLGCRDESRDCHHCGKSFPKPFKLQRHLPVHSAQRVYLCPRCPRVDAEPGPLQAHLAAAHGELGQREVPPTALFSCVLCADVACASKRAFVCSACNYTFAKKDQLRRHLAKHRRGPLPPAPLRRGRRPRVPRQHVLLDREIASSSERCREVVPRSPSRPNLPPPLSPEDTHPDLPSSCLDVASDPFSTSEGPGSSPSIGSQGPPEPLSPAPAHSKGCPLAVVPQNSPGEATPSASHSPAQTRQETKEKRAGGAWPESCRLSGSRPEAPSILQKKPTTCPPDAGMGSEGCRRLSKDRLGGASPSKVPQFATQPKKATRSPPPSEPCPQHSRVAGGSQPQPASGRLQSEAASTPSPARTPAEGCSKGEERKKGLDKPPRAPRKQATPSRVLPAKAKPGAQSSRIIRDSLGPPTLVLGDSKPQGLARAFSQVGSLHRRPKRGPAPTGPPSPRPCRTAESQSHLLNQLFGPRLSSFKIPLKKPSV